MSMKFASESEEDNSSSGSGSEKQQYQPVWYLVQGLGDDQTDNISSQDMISTISFDKIGNFLGLGDNGGRVVIFQFKEEGDSESVAQNGQTYPCLQYYTEFQSHEPEFNFQKSIEIPEKLTSIEWINKGYNGPNPQLVTANDKIIKLFQISLNKGPNDIEQEQDIQDEKEEQLSATAIFEKTNQIIFPRSKKNKQNESYPNIKLRDTYINGHQFHINSISQSADGECLFSADDITINLWNLENNLKFYNIINISPPKIEDLQEMITHCETHPSDSQQFLFCSSKGYFVICDLRCNTKYENFSTKFITIDDEGKSNYFSEIINSVTWASFSKDGQTVVSRDYLNVKVWDVRKPGILPLHNFKVQDYLEKNLQELYENDCIFDRFDAKMSPNGQYITTGGYNDCFQVIDQKYSRNSTLTANFHQKRFEQNEIIREYEEQGRFLEPIRNFDYKSVNFKNKITNTCWHPKLDCLAVSNQNCVFLFAK